MNLWLLTSQFPPSVIGGIARYVASAADMFAHAGHWVNVAVDQDKDRVEPSDVLLGMFAIDRDAEWWNI